MSKMSNDRFVLDNLFRKPEKMRSDLQTCSMVGKKNNLPSFSTDLLQVVAKHITTLADSQ